MFEAVSCSMKEAGQRDFTDYTDRPFLAMNSSRGFRPFPRLPLATSIHQKHEPSTLRLPNLCSAVFTYGSIIFVAIEGLNRPIISSPSLYCLDCCGWL